MNIGELFINLGIKGVNQTVDGINNVKKGMNSLVSESLAAKAAVIGVVYAIERLTGAAGEHGNELKNFQVFTGGDTTKLQQWQEAFRRTGQDVKEVQQDFLGIQKSVTSLLTHEGGLKFINTIGIDPTKITDTFYVLDRLREFVSKHQNDPKSFPLINKIVESFGVGEGLINTSRKFKGDIYSIKNNLLSPFEINALDRIKVKWEEFWKSLEITRDRVVSKYGGSLLTGISNDLIIIQDLVKGFSKLETQAPAVADAIKLITVALAAAAAAAYPITASILAIGYGLNGIQKFRTGQNSILGDLEFKLRDFFTYKPDNWHPPLLLPSSNNNSQNVNSNVTFNNYGGQAGYGSKDANSFEKHLSNILTQSNSRTQLH